MPRRKLTALPGQHPVVLALAVMILVLGVGGVALAQVNWGHRVGGDPPTPPRAPTTSAVPAAAPVLPSTARLKAVLRAPLSNSAFSGPPAVLIRDLQTGTLLYDSRGEVADVPASTAKLLIATVALTELGPQTRLETRVFRSGNTLYLVGGGDPTLSRSSGSSPGFAAPGPASLQDLAAKVAAAHLPRPDALVVDSGLFTGPALAPGWRPYYFGDEIAPVSALTVDEGRSSPGVLPAPRATRPPQVAAEAFRSALIGKGVAVPSVRSGRLPAGAQQIAVVQSPPLSTLVEHMLTWSDNDLAESLGRLVAVHRGRPGDFAGEAGALLDGLRELGLPVDGVRMNDASGLSHDDRVTPALLVEVLRRAAAPDHPELRAIIAGLPVAGRTGTLMDRYRTPDSKAGAGVVRAKTGKLAGVAALAGLVKDTDGRQLVFSLRAPSTDFTVGELAMDRVAATLARCGCR